MNKTDRPRNEPSPSPSGLVAWPCGYLPEDAKAADPNKIADYVNLTFEQRRAAQWARQK